ncbi:MAG: N-acetyl-1-D-myo-inositol-2-amino-2-deoxy-alpha-D-glucopyranoside deacetylase [Actinomycetes bacterium]
MDALDNPRRLLLVHAHPDDESITTGATIAHYAASGAAVTLVTCTRGERGEVIPSELAELEGDGEALAEHRTEELAAAMEALGVADHRFLGSDAGVRFEDSGMAYDEQGRAVAALDTPPGAFSKVPVDDAAGHLVRVLRQVRPQVVVTYEPGGGYGHPDHVHAHRVAVRAVELAADPGYGEDEIWAVSRVAETVVPRSVFDSGMQALAQEGLPTLAGVGVVPTTVVPDEQVDVVVDAGEQREAKAAALRAHATQVVVTGSTFALSNGLHQPLTGVEYYRLATGPGRRDESLATPLTDLFAGLPSA